MAERGYIPGIHYMASEVFNNRGHHLGALDQIEGRLIKSAVKGTKIRV